MNIHALFSAMLAFAGVKVLLGGIIEALLQLIFHCSCLSCFLCLCVLQARLCNCLSSLLGVAAVDCSVMDTLPSSLLRCILRRRGSLGCPLMLAAEGVLDPLFYGYFVASAREDTLPLWLLFRRILCRHAAG